MNSYLKEYFFPSTLKNKVFGFFIGMYGYMKNL